MQTNILYICVTAVKSQMSLTLYYLILPVVHRNLMICLSGLDQIMDPPDWDYNGTKSPGLPSSRAPPLRMSFKGFLFVTCCTIFISV